MMVLKGAVMLNEDPLVGYMAGNQEGRSPFIGPSSLKNCYRRHAFAYLGVPASDEVGTDMADLGTMLHMGYSALLREQFAPDERRPDVEIRTAGMPRSGSADDVDFANRVVTDLKSTSGRVFQSWIDQGGPYASYWDQLEVYGLGLHQMYGGIWTLRILGIDRDSGRRLVWEREQDIEAAELLVGLVSERHAALMDAVAMVDAGADPLEVVDGFPREGRGPGRGFPCDWCQFASVCWPAPSSDDGTPQSETVRGDDAEVGRFAAEYMEAAAEARKADARKKDAQAFIKGLDGEFPGPDGGVFKISTVAGRSKRVVDCEAAALRLAELGEEVPMKLQVGASYPRVMRK